jgi:hypothetical protein
MPEDDSNPIRGGSLHAHRGVPEFEPYLQKLPAHYAISLAWPGSWMRMKSLRSDSPHESREIARIQLLGVDRDLPWSRDANGLVVRCHILSQTR